ncbi:unnamed protein product [Caenorhabditis bovis]|uniref:Protein phosphatase 1 regulatory subunit 7 n=1 Tax=Caenorhabditis bovis TaxID=2654633 RepID=A0A8S1EU73_9PELO|nr:unnamed protein product [Caenorhabditis bovis]
MRVPAGAPVPFWLSVKNRLPKFAGSSPSLGTVAVAATVLITGAAVFSITLYPKIYNDYYKRAQKEERALLRATREELAGSMTTEEKQTPAISDADTDGEKSGDEKEELGGVVRNQFDLSTLSDDTKEIDITHTRADAVPDMTRFKNLQELCIRTNLLTEINERMLSLNNLVELDLYENQITEIKNLDNLVNLVKLDLSYNRIREIKGLENLKKLEVIYFVHNKISVIENLDNLKELKLLELGDNRIKKIENISHLVNLKELYLGKNKIRHIEGIEKLQNLRLFSIPGNRLVSIDNLSSLADLEELYISDQGLQNLEGIETMKNLRVLDVANNEITSFSSVSLLENLEDFWANDNRIESWKEVDKLANLSKLDTVYLERNPIYTSDRTSYRRKVMLALKQIKQLDANLCAH